MKNNIIEAEFKVVQERTLEVIATEIKTIDNHVCQVVLQGAIEIGIKLDEAKEKVGHGNWEKWCKENLNYSKSQAERFMKIASDYGEKNSPYMIAISKTYTCTDFSISKAFRLLQVPEDEVESFSENVDLDNITVKELEDEIRKLKEENNSTEELEKKLKIAEAEKNATYELLQELQKQQIERENEKSREGEELDEKTKEELEKKDAEIKKLQSDLEKKKAEEQKLKDKLAKADEAKQKEIDEAIEKTKTEANEAAEQNVSDTLERLTEEKMQALAKADQAEKKLVASSNESAVKLKIKFEDLQKSFGECKEALANIKNEEQKIKLIGAIKSVLEGMIEKL